MNKLRREGKERIRIKHTLYFDKFYEVVDKVHSPVGRINFSGNIKPNWNTNNITKSISSHEHICIGH